jgi:hypothetical protein
MRPDHFGDISAVLALYRPGPMGAKSHTNYAMRKQGQQPITPIHPELADALNDILGPTYGLIVYQEQVMEIAQRVAGYTLGQADNLRRAMGKKSKEALDKEFPRFSEGMMERGFSKPAITTLWDILVPFSDYAFNKSHSAAYGVIAYFTAYLKAHYAAEFVAALLTSVGDDRDKLGGYLVEARRMGVTVLPPDINESDLYFAAVGEDVRFGLGSIKNVGESVVAHITAERTERGERTEGGQGRRERSPRGERNDGRRERAPRLDENGNPEVLPLDPAADAEGQAPQTDENGGERRERRSRDRYGRDRRERGDRAPREEGSAEHADNEQAPQEASDTRAQAQSAAPVAEASARAGMPVVQAFTLPVADMQAVAQGSGLEWINSNPERIAAVQAAIAAEPKPVHVPRERPPLVILDEGPLVLVETRKDL